MVITQGSLPRQTSWEDLEEGAGKNAAATTELTIGQLYHKYSTPEEAWDRFINMLLDQKIFYISGLSQGALADASGAPLEDVFGLIPPENVDATSAAMTNLPMGSQMVPIESSNGQSILLQGYMAETNIAEGDVDDEAFEEWKAINFGGQAYLYYVVDPDDPSENFAITPSYDGSVYGNLSTFEEALVGVPLDKPSMDAYVANLAIVDPYKYRSLQSSMHLLGFYGENTGNIRWGAHTSVDRNAFLWMMGELITEHLRVGQYNRVNPTAQMPSPTIRSFLDQKYTEHWEQAVRDSAMYADPSTAFETLTADITTHVVDNLSNSLNSLGRVVTQEMKDRIRSTVNDLYSQGELDAAALLNTDIMGMQTTDDVVALADSWLAAFHGNEEGWQSRIRLGTTGTPSEMLRIARTAGVDLTGVGVLSDMTSVGSGMMWHPEAEPVKAPDEQQRLGMARWYFTMLLDQNNGDMAAAANQYAHTIGNGVYADRSFDGQWLDQTIQQARQDPTSFSFQQGIQTLEEQTQERIDILNNAEARIMAAGTFSDVSNDLATAAAASVLDSFAARKGQRRSRL